MTDPGTPDPDGELSVSGLLASVTTYRSRRNGIRPYFW